ncbi:uncharacterized protein LOC135218464 [Macrobrachium nipponense]|uniref:uncharacterized protein LOC135218464 n=1 Tax=Macrobrachium nipponense TaxID=159736 RepID=UPI0030C80739
MSQQAHGRRTQARLFIAVLSWCILQDASAQIALTSPSSTSMTLRSGGGILALPLTGHAPKQVASSLLTKLTDRQLPSQRSASTRESEIAAIFRGVAYGAPTFSSNTSTSSTPAAPTESTTTSTSTAPPTTTSFINSVHDPVRSELMRHQIEKEIEFVMTTRTVPSVIEVNADSIPYVLHEEDSFRDTSYPHRTPDPSILNKDIAKFPTVPAISGDTLIVNKNHVGGIKGENDIFPKTDVKWALGAAWWIHVYVSAGLFALTAAASLCCLARLSPATHLVSRLRYRILLALVFLAAMLRCLHLFHDPYGIENRLPEFITAIIEEISWPCLIAAVAVVALSLYQSSRCSRVFPKSSRLPFALAFFTTAHLIVSITAHLVASLVEKYAFPLRITAQSLAVIWGSFVGFCSLWAVWKVERSAGRYSGHLLGRLNRSATDDLVSSSQPNSTVNRGAILILVAGGGQIMLSALHFYIMLAPVSPTKHIWVWWGRVSMARGLELIISIAVLAGAFILTSGRPSNSKQDSTIFSVLTSCGRDNKSVKGGRSANVFPVQNEKRQILGSFNFHTSKPSVNDGIKRMPIDWTYTTPRCASKSGTMDSVTSDFQLLWNRDRTQSAAGFRPSSMLVNDSGFVRFRTQVDPEQPMDEVFNRSSLNLHIASTPIQYNNVHNYSTQTLPNSRYYCKPNTASLSSPERTPLRNPIRAQTVRAQRSRPDYLRHHMRNRTMSHLSNKPTWTPVSSASKYDVRTLDKYEVASYYNNSIASNGSNMYSTPHTVSPSPQYLPAHSVQNQLPEVHGTPHLYEEARHLKPPSAEGISGILEPSTCSSLSEIHVDYLTDVSSSNDCMNQHSLPYTNCSKRDQSMLTLPLSSTHTSYAQSLPTYTAPMGRTPPSHLPDITPDSAVILDYSTSAETEEEADKDSRNKSLDLIKMSSNSLNDVLKGQARAGLLSKIVGNSMSVSCYGYSPLDVEDTSSPSQEDSSMTRIRKVASSTDLGDAKEVPKTPTTPPVYSKPPNTVTSL